jgi:hypothetical protein
MREQEVRNLWEAYLEVCENQQLDEVSDLNEAEIMKHQKERSAIERRKKMKGYEPPTKGVHGEIERRQAQKPPSKLRSGSLPESYDLFDTILEHLVAEGYADTNESALVIMANMSEEWKQSILDEEKKELPQTKMYRKAGELARSGIATGDEGKKKRSAKIVSAITRETERKRFDEIGKSPKHN